jgi:hypothetical protein
MHVLLPALSRLVGVISQHGGSRGEPHPHHNAIRLRETDCVDKAASIGGLSPFEANDDREAQVWHGRLPV